MIILYNKDTSTNYRIKRKDNLVGNVEASRKKKKDVSKD